MKRHLLQNRGSLLVAAGLLLLALVFFWPVTLGGRTLLPADVLYQYAPWSDSAAEVGAATPQNHLLADLILENYQWKRFILQSLSDRQVPLWNPYLFAGVPFLAAGQHSALYPLSLIFYLVPLAEAYGLFTAAQIFLAALGGYALLRVLGTGRFAAVIGGLTFAFSGFMLVSVAFTMVIAAACWLPWALAATELAIRGYDASIHRQTSPRLLYLLLGSAVLGVQFLAGHVDTSYYILMVLAFYAVCRLAGILRRDRDLGAVLRLGVMLLGMVALALALSAVQLVPLFELVRANFRQGSASYNDVVGWALPARRAISFLIPDFFGNPSQHSYFDLLTLSVQSVTRNFQGQALANIPENIFGIKNYVESAAYVGILPLVLAAAALARHLGAGSRQVAGSQPSVDASGQRRTMFIFLSLAVLSLLFAFGTPLYALLFYGLPGYSQLHSPFRWILPYTMSIAVLAGLGAQALTDWRRGAAGAVAASGGREAVSGVPSRLGWAAFWLGLGGLAALGVSWLARDQMVGLAQAVMLRSASLQEVFSGGAMLYSYEARNVGVFCLFLLLAGIVVRVSRCPIYLPHLTVRRPSGEAPAGSGDGAARQRMPLWQPLAVLVLILDLYVAFGSFNPAVDPKLLDTVPQAIRFLQADGDLYRVMGYGPDKPLHANAAMSYQIQDSRGYDSIIPKQYADFMGLIEGQGSLLYNRIGDITWAGNLDSQLLDLLNVRYVVTTQPVANAGYTLVYSDEVRIYRNDDVLPRALAVFESKVVDQASLGQELRSLNPRQTVLLDAAAGVLAHTGEAHGSTGGSGLAAVTITDYRPNQVGISATLPLSGYLVLADSYFEGWTAQDRGRDVAILRADGNFRAVALGPGEHSVVFKYSPLSFRLGLFATFSAGVVLLLGLSIWLWRRYYQEREDDHAARRVVKNALTPMATNLLNKGIDFAFAMLSLRLLGPEGSGRFSYAVNLALFFGIVTDFGLGVLATREVGKDRTQGNRYLTNTVLVRVVLSVFAMLPMLAVVNLNATLTPDTVAVIVLLWVSLVPSGIASSLSYLFNAYERFEFPAMVTVMVKVSSTFVAATVLLLGGGIVGLAAVSVLANLGSVGILFYLVRSRLFVPRWQPDLSLIRRMVVDAYPLMINNLLATVFFRINVQILQPLKGDEVVGYYNAAYRYIDGLNIIPANLTLALFPLLSRYGTTAKESMMRAYQGSLRFLILAALPLCVGIALTARELIVILGDKAFLPHSMIALQILVWFLPFSFINSVTQYVLIALNQQRFLTLAFLIGVAFNLGANLLLIPAYSYVGAAGVTIASEIVLLVPFYYSVRRHLGTVPWLALFWRPVLAAAAMAVVGWGLAQVVNPLVAVVPAGLVYGLALVVTRSFTGEDVALVKRLAGR